MDAEQFLTLERNDIITVLEDGIEYEVAVKDINRRMGRVQLAVVQYYDDESGDIYDSIEDFIDALRFNEEEEDVDERVNELEEAYLQPFYWMHYKDICEV